MYRCWLFGIFLMCKTIVVVNTAAIDRWELRFALHETLETALISPLNLFKLSEVFFPRRHDVIISPVSVQVTYNLTCQEPAIVLCKLKMTVSVVMKDHIFGQVFLSIEQTGLHSVSWNHFHSGILVGQFPWLSCHWRSKASRVVQADRM